MTGTKTRRTGAANSPGYTNPEGETPAGRPARPVIPVIPVRLANPRSVIGTPQWTGPYSKLRVNPVTRYLEAERAWFLIHRGGLSVRQTAQALGLSATTAWRRACWYNDATSNRFHGFPDGPPPHQRGTRAVPRGRPIVLPMDAQSVLRDLLAAGYRPQDIVASPRTVPACVRRLAALLVDEKPGEAL
jgi:hypothetical protein